MSGDLDFDLNAEKERVRSAVTRIWQHPVDRFYTDHGVAHSDRIFGKCEALKYAWDLTQEELDVLWVCAYIHDIGMQFSDWGRFLARDGRSVAAVLEVPLIEDPNIVRERHCELGMNLIRAELHGKRIWDSPLSFVSSTVGHPPFFLWNCAQIAFAHSSGPVWDELRLKPPRDVKFPGASRTEIRTALLMGIFRLADELDGCQARIPDPSRLANLATPGGSIPHWLACWFVEEVAVGADRDSIDITIDWWVPDGASGEEVAEIRELLRIFKVKKIRKTTGEVASFFSRARRDAQHRSVSIRGLDDSDSPREVPFPMWPMLRPAVLESLRSHGWQPPARIFLAGEGHFGVPVDATSLEAALRNWSLGADGFRRGNHFILERGLHTDTFVNCRALGSSRELVIALCDYLDARIPEIDTCIAVGTSMIPFALEFARRRGARLTFTFANTKLRIGESQIDRFTEIEALPFVNGDVKSALVLDDIIAVGEGAQSVVELVRAASVEGAVSIHHYSLFRLGTQAYIEMPGVSYGWVCAIPDVRYWKPEACQLCKESGYSIRESEVL